jgi:hypothetical protein
VESPPRRLLFVVTALAAIVLLGGIAAAALQWKRLRVAFAVERLVAGRCERCCRLQSIGLDSGRYRDHYRSAGPDCGWRCPERARVELAQIAETSPELLDPYVDDERPLGDGSVGDWMVRSREIAEARRLIREGK